MRGPELSRTIGKPILSLMILAPIRDPVLRETVRRAALPEEDVFHETDDVLRALRRGFPRVLVCWAEEGQSPVTGTLLKETAIPVLTIGRSCMREWDLAWRADGFAIRRIDDTALRLRSLMEQAADRPEWVERLFSDLTTLLGAGLPPELRGLARRVLEFPERYPFLHSLEEAAGLSSGALKARFRRKGLPSPSLYLGWFRVMAASRVLSEPGQTIFSASHRMGYASDGNFCRWVRGVSGLPPSRIRGMEGRMLLLLRLVEKCFPPGALSRWRTLSGLFLRQVA